MERWWPETPNRAEAETITLDGADHFNLAYAIFPAAPAGVDPARVLTLSGQPAPGATRTAVPDYVEAGPAGEDCLQRYSWKLDGVTVPGAFGPTFVVPLNADGTDVTLTFADVGTPGITTVTRLESGAGFPDGGFSSLTSPPLYYDVETTAVFSSALGALVCITFDTSVMTDVQAAGQRLYHYMGGTWADITDTALSGTGKVCGRLGGNRGLGILAAGAPSSSAIACPGGAALDDIEQTVAAGSSSLSYAAGSDTYTYVWKTQKAWAGTCRQFSLRLNDGSVHGALFDFRK